MKKIIPLLAIVLILLIPSVLASMPPGHKFMTTETLKTPIDSEFYRACARDPGLCYAGDQMVDVSVMKYWVQGEKYVVTHSPNFCRRLIEEAQTDDEYTCAVGGCLHQPQDIPFHSERLSLVPSTILKTKLTNEIIHVFSEQKVDNWVVKTNPGIEDEIISDLNDYETCMPLFKRVMLGYDEYSDTSESEIDDLFDKFILEIQTSKTGYDAAYQNKSFMVNLKTIPFPVIIGYIALMSGFGILSLLVLIRLKNDANRKKLRYWIALIIFLPIFLILGYIFVMNLQGQAFNAVINVARPISNFVPLENHPEYYINKGIENSRAFLQEGEIWLQNTDASGFGMLEQADRSIINWDYGIALILSLALIWFCVFLFKKKKFRGFEPLFKKLKF